MKAKIKAIIAATATAAMSLGIVATATADTTVKSNVKAEELPHVEEIEKTPADVSVKPETEPKVPLDLEEIDETSAKNLAQLPVDIQRVGVEQAYTPFEMKLLERRSTSALSYNFVASGRIPNNDPIDPPLQRSTDVKLTKVDNDAYDQWEGRFTTNSVGGFAVEFTDPKTFMCKTGFTPIITTKTSAYMDSNFKTVKAVYTYREYDYKGIMRIVSYPYENSGNQKTIICWNAADHSGDKSILVEATYYFTMYAGSNSSSPIHEQAIVHVVKSDYAQSAAYAQNSYAYLIDNYTYVDTSELDE